MQVGKQILIVYKLMNLIIVPILGAEDMFIEDTHLFVPNTGNDCNNSGLPQGVGQ